MGAAGPLLAQPANQPAAASPAPLRSLPDFAGPGRAGRPLRRQHPHHREGQPGQPGSQEEQMLEFFRRLACRCRPGAAPRGSRPNRGPEGARVASARASCSAPTASS